MSFLYIQAHPGHFFSERVPQRTLTDSPVSTFSMERGYEHGCSPSGTACIAAPWNRHFEAVSPFGLSEFSFTNTTHFGGNAEPQKCHDFVMALYKNHASDERKTPYSPTKTLDSQARFFFTRWMSGVRAPHRPLSRSYCKHWDCTICGFPSPRVGRASADGQNALSVGRSRRRGTGKRPGKVS